MIPKITKQKSRRFNKQLMVVVRIADMVKRYSDEF